jgi:SNF2 family DNA or RNA helicase
MSGPFRFGNQVQRGPYLKPEAERKPVTDTPANFFLVPPWEHQRRAFEVAKQMPEYALLFEAGCLTHDALIRVNRAGKAFEITLEQLYRNFNNVEMGTRDAWDTGIKTYVRSFNGDHVCLNEIEAVVRSGEKEVFSVSTTNHGNPLRATADHLFLTQDGFKPLRDLRVGETKLAFDYLHRHMKTGSGAKKEKPRYSDIQVGIHHKYARIFPHPYNGRRCKRLEKHRAIFEAHLNGLTLAQFQAETKKPNKLKYIDPKKFHVHHIDKNPRNNALENLQLLTAKEHISGHSKGYANFKHGVISWRTVTEIKRVGVEMTYDICCKAPHHNFVANGLVVHNSGKTRVAIDLLRWKCLAHSRILRTLIICPVVVCENWAREFQKNSKISDRVFVLKGSGKKRLDLFNKVIAADPNAVFITNFETLTMKPMVEAFEKWQPEAMAVDESQRMKSPQSKRSKTCFQLASLTRYRWILSGTPILNSPMDAFQQFKILDKGETFGHNFFSFRAKYFFDKNAGMPAQRYFPDWRIRAGASDELGRLMYRKAMRVVKSECLDLPPLVRDTVEVEMAPDQARAYEQMKKDFVAFLKSKVCTAQLAITKGLRLQQIVSGFLKAEDGTEVVFDDCPRIAALADLLEDIAPNHKVIVWAVFHANYAVIRQVCEKLGLGYTQLHGEVTGKERQANIDMFQNDPKCRVMIANQASGGVGVNLTASSYSIFFSRNFSLENDLQAEARNYRGGSSIHEKVTRLDLVTPGTIDAQVLQALTSKANVAESILKWGNII